MSQQEVFINAVTQQLTEFYTTLKERQKPNEKLMARIEGFMLAGVMLDLTTNIELKALMENVHFAVFGKTIEERRIESALKGDSEEVWALYDEPAWKRKPR